jgi:hypothetical protein
MKLTERLSPGDERGVFLLDPGRCTPSSRPSSSGLPVRAALRGQPCFRSLQVRPAPHPASARFGPLSTLLQLASARPAPCLTSLRPAPRSTLCVLYAMPCGSAIASLTWPCAKGLFWKSRVHRRESMLRFRRRRHCRRRQHCRCAPRRAVNDEPT